MAQGMDKSKSLLRLCMNGRGHPSDLSYGCVLATVLLVGVGNAALSALQAGAISTALPFTFIMLFASVSLLRGLYLEAFHLRELNRD